MAAGKRLAEYNKKARDEKRALQAQNRRLESAQQHEPSPATLRDDGEPEKQTMSGLYLLSIAGFVVSLLGLYYKRREALGLLQKVTKPEPSPLAKKAATPAPERATAAEPSPNALVPMA